MFQATTAGWVWPSVSYRLILKQYKLIFEFDFLMLTLPVPIPDEEKKLN